ncbi:MAG: hypothetical protein U0746_09395 [Gemmataceae bacterium]
MTEHQRLFWAQARSDFAVYEYLAEQPYCHRLHYLQMSSEKLAKAYVLHRRAQVAMKSHKAFIAFWRTIADNDRVRMSLGYGRQQQWQEKLRSASDIAYAIQQLAPALAKDGPNPEYPWPHDDPKYAPVEYAFPIEQRLESSRQGQDFIRLLSRLIENFPQWWA